MKSCSSVRFGLTVFALAAAALLPARAAAQVVQPTPQSGKWQFGATLYGYVPTIKGTVTYAGDTRTSDIHVSKSSLLSHLKMVFEGAFDAHYGQWGIFNDVIYVDLGGDKSHTSDFAIGSIGIPASAAADLSLDLKSLVWTVAGEYRVMSDSAWTVDLYAGTRLLRIKPTLDYSITGDLGPIVLPGRVGSKQADERLWDGIIGLKGRRAFGAERKWLVPFVLDVGTGQTKLTWQAAAGIGYAFRWGDAVATYRHMDWHAKSGKRIEDLNFGGPMIAATFRW